MQKKGQSGSLPKVRMGASLQLLSAKVGLSLGEHSARMSILMIYTYFMIFSFDLSLTRFANRFSSLCGKKMAGPKVFGFLLLLLVAHLAQGIYLQSS